MKSAKIKFAVNLKISKCFCQFPNIKTLAFWSFDVNFSLFLYYMFPVQNPSLIGAAIVDRMEKSTDALQTSGVFGQPAMQHDTARRIACCSLPFGSDSPNTSRAIQFSLYSRVKINTYTHHESKMDLISLLLTFFPNLSLVFFKEPSRQVFA